MTEEQFQELKDILADQEELRQLGHYVVVDDQGRCNVAMAGDPEEIRRRMKSRAARSAKALCKYMFST